MPADHSPSLRDRLRYRFDNTISRGAVAVVGWLAVATLAAILAAAAVLSLFVRIEGARPSFIEGFWISLLRTLDPGTMGGDLGWGFRITSLLVTFAGLFIVATLIGLISSGIDQKLEGIRKGRTEVLERGHTLILGWSPKLFSIIEELIVANESESRASIVVMAPHDKIEMEDEIRERVGSPKTRIVCRTGDPASPADLDLVHPLRAKSVIVLAPEGATPDARVVKTVLALSRIDPAFETLRVVAELSDPKHERALVAATNGRVTTIISEDVIARITAQVCRASGLSAVYQDLLDFDGDEIYFFADERLNAATFADVLLAFEACSVLGIHRADGSIELRPEMTTRFAPGDEVIVIASDDSAITWSPVQVDSPSTNAAVTPRASAPERTLILGWNALGERVLRQLDRSVVQGSSVRIARDASLAGAHDVIGQERFANLVVSTIDADTNDPDQLAAILSEDAFDHLMILCYRDGLEADDAEARALMTLVQVRQQLSRTTDRARMSIVTELLDVRDVELAKVANPDDYIVSLSLTSLMLAQLSENPKLSGVFDELFDPEGCELSLAPASDYLEPGRERTFGQVVAAVAARGDVALGYRIGPRAGTPASIQLNPDKAARMTLGAADQLIVLR